MYKLNTNNTTYLVPLDGLDLNSLRRSFDSGGVKPLWKVPSGDEYYEFKLNAWRVSEDSDGEDVTGLESESQICHICNTHVPIVYIKEHNNSIKHINMKKIHDLITLRGRLPALTSSEEHMLSITNYYCEDCSMVVLKSNRQNHEDSYTHKKSLRNKDLIEQFLKFYSKDLNENEVKKPIRDYFNKYVNKKNLSYKIDVAGDDVIIIMIKDCKVKIHNNNFHGFVKMDQDLICILCEVQLHVGGVEPHIESKKHRKKVVRNMDDQHCIREMNEDFAHCLLCNELVLLTRVAGHRLLSYHTSNLNQALGRKTRDFNKNYVSSSENTGFENLSDELQSDNGESDDGNVIDDVQRCDGKIHENIEDYCSENDTSQDVKQTYCHVCNIYIDTHNFMNHKMGNSHIQMELNKMKSDVKCQQKIKDNILKNIETNLDYDSAKNAAAVATNTKKTAVANSERKLKPLSIHYHMEESSYNIVYCRVCKIKMYIEDMNSHINQESHINNYENLLEVNKMLKKNEYVCFCQLCDYPVIVTCELDHIYSLRHRTNMNYEHQACLETNNNKDVMNNNQTTNCENDDNSKSEISNKIDEITQANEGGVKHDENESQNSTELTEIPTDFIEKINYQIHEATNENKIICKVCNVMMSNTDEDIYKHFNCEDHASTYSELLKMNRVTKAQNKFFCYACKTSITSKNELDHIFGNKHKSKFPNHDIDVACKISCQINEGQIFVTVQSTEVLEKDYAQTTNAIPTLDVKEKAQLTDSKTNGFSAEIENAQAVFLKQYYLVSKTKNPSEVICKICNIILTNSMLNIESHMIGANHLNRYENVLKINGVKKQNNGFYCEACKVFLTNKNELIHIEGVRHQSNVLNYAISCLETGNYQGSGEIISGTSDTQRNSAELQPPIGKTENIVTEDAISESNNIDVGATNDNFETSNDEEIDQPSKTEDNDEKSVKITDEFENTHPEHEIAEYLMLVDNANAADAEASNDSLATSDVDEKYNQSSYIGSNQDQILETEVTENGQPSTETVNAQVAFSKPYYHVSKTSNPAEVLCKVCNVLLTYSHINIETHIMGLNHTNKYKILIDKNGLKKENNRYFCEICNVFVSNKNEIEHIKGFKHKARLPSDGDCIFNSM